VVTVRGARPRTVPVLARYHARLLAAARFAGNGLICGGAGPGRRNITHPLVTALDGGGGLPRLDTSRLRATWLAGCVGLLGLATFMLAAGISCSQRLGDLVAGRVSVRVRRCPPISAQCCGTFLLYSPPWPRPWRSSTGSRKHGVPNLAELLDQVSNPPRHQCGTDRLPLRLAIDVNLSVGPTASGAQ
jgi:hypothetical protein